MRFLLSWPGLAAIVALILAPPADARTLVFDFDDDGDPRTWESSVVAPTGTLLEAFLVVTDFPEPYEELHYLEFGLVLSSGLELVGIGAVEGDAVFYHRGPESIAIGSSVPLDRDDLPAFQVRVVFRVEAQGPQSVKVVPSERLSGPLDGFLFGLWDGEALVDVIDEDVLALQQWARVNDGDLPTERRSWASIKDDYDAEVSR